MRIKQSGTEKSVSLHLAPGEADIITQPEQAFPPAVKAGGQFNLRAFPTNALPEAAFVLKLRQEVWALYVEGRPLAVFPRPFAPPVDVLQTAATLPPEASLDCRFQKVADIRFEDNFLVSEEDENQLGAWETERGSWLLHTAADNAVERENIEPDAKHKPLAEFSPNFYSLTGRGTNAMITAGYDFYDAYSMETSVHVVPGDVGLAFYVQPDKSFHAFTIQFDASSHRARLLLWRGDSTGARRDILGAVDTELTPGQWVKLGVRTFQNRVQGFMDKVKVLDLQLELPVGGRFGLFFNGSSSARFDDVVVSSNHDPDFMGVSRLRSQVLVEHGEFFPKRRFFKLFAPRETGTSLEPPAVGKPQWLVVGSTSHRGHVFSADFHPEKAGVEVGLLAGYTGDEAPYYRFRYTRTVTNDVFVLERLSTNGVAAVESFSRPRHSDSKAAPSFTLKADAIDRGLLRLYHDDRLVLVHHAGHDIIGASGIYVGPESAVRLSDPEYTFHRKDLFRNRFEKNRAFVQDPFMRHWSSPEGQWIEQKDKSVWYKSDFFGRFTVRMPYVPNSEVHLGVEEGQTNGVLVIHAETNGLKAIARSGRQAPAVIGTAPADTIVHAVHGEEEPTTNRWYTAHVEGHWFWITSGGAPLLKHPLRRPLKGTRMRIAGFSTEQLKYSVVERYRVKDYLFTEALHDWVINGGKWEVINRFQCQPRWSHMNGESDTGLAALWTKYIFGGDFCMEMYAGIRHGVWYQRCGDLNLTLMADRTTPGSGYTVTCTGWDTDHSQLFTRLYRQGRVVAESDKYLVPRRREGNVRKGYNPLLGGGRAVHGAWYYIKFRRIGNKLEYYFDNELVFSWDDPDPIPRGLAGIWTYLNSMVVARVKIAAERIVPAGFDFTRVDPAPLPVDSTGPPPASRPSLVQTHAGPLDGITPDAWSIDDTVGRSRLTFPVLPGTGTCMRVQNVLGGGRLFAAADLPPVPYPDLAGWHLYLKRTPDAQFNIHYSMGRLDEEGTYTPQRFYFHGVSGSDFTKGKYKLAGHTEVQGSPVTNDQWMTDAPWTPVFVWLPTEGLHSYASDTNFLVRFEGVGNLQPSYVQQGLTGNGPDAAYAVRDLTAVGFAPPRLGLSSNAGASCSFSLLDVPGGKVRYNGPDLEALQDKLGALGGTGIVAARLRVEQGGAPESVNDLVWLKLPDTPRLACRWAKDAPDAIDLLGETAFPDRRFCFASVTVNGHAVEADGRTQAFRRFPLPRLPDMSASSSNDLAIACALPNDEIRRLSLAWKDRPGNTPPVLLSLEGPVPLSLNFENHKLDPVGPGGAGITRLQHFDAEQGTYLRVANTELHQRLKTLIHSELDLARFPLCQFRYRAPRMAQVSLSFDQRYAVRLAEDFSKATDVAGLAPFTPDNTWRTWLGRAVDGVTEHALHADLFSVDSLCLGSLSRVDQTGRFTHWDLDDVVCGPALSDPAKLSVTPRYFDHDGVARVLVATRGGVKDFRALSPEERKLLAWQETENGRPVQPVVKDIEDGICHLFLKAEDTQGTGSAVTDIPFLLDRQPIEATHAFVETNAPDSNGTLLRVSLDTGGGAPVDLSALNLQWESDNVPVSALGSSLIHAPDKDTLVLNWPFLFRNQLNATTNGQVSRISVATIRDGAGNATRNVTTTVRVDYDSDDTPPSLLPSRLPTNVLWRTAWEVASTRTTYFRSLPRDALELVREPESEAFLRLTPQKGKARMSVAFRKDEWCPAAHPYLAFRVRRPDMRPDEATAIVMTLELSDQGKRHLSLTQATDGKTSISLDTPIAWQSNTWHAVAFDLAAALAGTVKPDSLADLTVKALHVSVKDAEADQPLDLQSVFVFSRWQQEDTVDMRAYDASGVGGLTWTCDKQSSGTSLSPASLQANLAGEGWLVMRMRDKAGNLSTPLHVPLYAATPEPKARQDR